MRGTILACVVLAALFAGACEADYDPHESHPVVGYGGGPQLAYQKPRGGTESKKTEDTGTSKPADAVSQKDAQEEAVGVDAEETDYGTYINSCLGEDKVHTLDFCACREKEAEVHPGTTDWCKCHWLVCHKDADEAYCANNFYTCYAVYSTDCAGFDTCVQ